VEVIDVALVVYVTIVLFILPSVFRCYSRQSVFLMAIARLMQTLEGFVHIVGWRNVLTLAWTRISS